MNEESIMTDNQNIGQLGDHFYRIEMKPEEMSVYFWRIKDNDDSVDLLDFEADPVSTQ